MHSVPRDVVIEASTQTHCVMPYSSLVYFNQETIFFLGKAVMCSSLSKFALT